MIKAFWKFLLLIFVGEGLSHVGCVHSICSEHPGGHLDNDDDDDDDEDDDHDDDDDDDDDEVNDDADDADDIISVGEKKDDIQFFFAERLRWPMANG